MVERASTLPAARRHPAKEGPPVPASVPAPRRMQAAVPTGSVILCLLILSLLFPFFFHLGTMRLTVYRLLLLAVFVPLVVRWLSGAAGRANAVDVLVLLHCIWMSLAILAVHGLGRIPFVGITTIELFGGYLVGRTLVENRHVFKSMFRYFLIFLLILAPFAIHELLTERVVLNEIFAPVFETNSNVYHDPRAGFWRVQASFEHPILFGLFCSIGLANIFYIYRAELAKQLTYTGFAVCMTFCSLSSAPLLSSCLQVGLTLWDKVTRARWWLLVVLVVLGYVTIDLLSNRTPIRILISVATFDPWTGFTRLAQWDYASAEVLRNPVFGIGFNSWQRPGWLNASIDNYWLALAVRGGLPTVAFILVGLGLHIRNLVRLRGLDAEVKDYRTGYLIGLIGLMLTLCTVHIWGGTSVFVMTYIGAGAWFYARASGEVGDGAEAVERRAGTRTGRARHQQELGRAGEAEPAPTTLPFEPPPLEPPRADYMTASRGRGPIRASTPHRERP